MPISCDSTRHFGGKLEKSLYNADPADLFRCSLADDYQIIDGATDREIVPVGLHKGRMSPGLRDPDLFGSFARLWADGEPSEARILR